MYARAFEDLDELPPETTLLGGRITIDVRIGRGGAATVYAATMADGRQVALKIMSGEHAELATSRQRFRNEVALAQHLADHPRVVTPYEMGELPELGGRPYVTMPLVKGRSLVLLLGRLEVPDAVALLRDLARIVADVHDRGIIHRDIKPANVIVQQWEGARIPFLLDFGMAYSRGDGTAPATAGLTAAHELPGTKHYMAPEQITGATPDARFDVYALGVTMYEVLTGVVPLDDLSPADAARRKCDPNLPPLSIAGRVHDLPEDLEQTIDAALERDPAQRVPSAADLVDRLTEVLDRIRGESLGRAGGTKPVPQAVVPVADETELVGRAPARRWVVLAGVAALLIALLGVGLALPSGSTNGTNAPADRTEPRTPSMAASSSAEPDEREALVDRTGPDVPDPIPAEPDIGSADPAGLPNEGAADAESSSAAVEDAAPKSPAAKRHRPPRRKEATGPSCSEVVAEARAATTERKWTQVVRLTNSVRCWDSRHERLALRIDALLELGRFDECVELGRSSKVAEISRVAATCEQQLDKESTP